MTPLLLILKHPSNILRKEGLKSAWKFVCNWGIHTGRARKLPGGKKRENQREIRKKNFTVCVAGDLKVYLNLTFYVLQFSQ